MQERTGQCVCGGVSYKISGEVIGIINCHCKECQRLHGNYNPMLVVDKEGFVLTKDNELAWYDSSEDKQRGFCRLCGAACLMRQTNGPKVLVSVGSLDETDDLENLQNVWTGQAGDYYVLPPEGAEAGKK